MYVADESVLSLVGTSKVQYCKATYSQKRLISPTPFADVSKQLNTIQTCVTVTYLRVNGLLVTNGSRMLLLGCSSNSRKSSTQFHAASASQLVTRTDDLKKTGRKPIA